MVYVLSIDNEPLMPCSNVIARLLLKQGKAKVKYLEPFTIKLTYETTTYTQPLTLGVDTGSQTFATAVADEKGNILEDKVKEAMNAVVKAFPDFKGNDQQNNGGFQQIGSSGSNQSTNTVDDKLDAIFGVKKK